MSQAMIPRSYRSATALDGESDVRDDLIYSSIIVGHGGASQQKLFTVPQGQAIPRMVGAAIAPTQLHQLIHSELSTCQDKAGEFGSSIGDAAVRSISLVLEQACPMVATVAGLVGGLNMGFGVYGATPQEVAEVLSKSFFQLKVGGKTMIQGPVGQFPAGAGVSGAIATTQTASTIGFAQNGSNLSGKRIRIPIQIARNDVVTGIIGVPNGAAYVFSVAAGVGQSSMLTCVLGALVRGDVR